MNRSILRKLARTRLREAKTLLINGNYDGAYYLAGYAIECALKACIARKINKYDFPDKQLVNQSYSHDFLSLIKVAGLSAVHQQIVNQNNNFSAKWNVVKDWNETSRYEFHNKQKAKDIYNSIVSRNNGVLRWIKQYW